jgi:hypothetical protein
MIYYHKIRGTHIHKCIETSLISNPVSIPGNFMYVQSFLLGSLLFNSKFLDAGAEGIGVHPQD